MSVTLELTPVARFAGEGFVGMSGGSGTNGIVSVTPPGTIDASRYQNSVSSTGRSLGLSILYSVRNVLRLCCRRTAGEARAANRAGQGFV